jgi:diketogulonate reductase-like aldo/keto reductase
MSNVSVQHLQQMIALHGETPAFVQNRCFARMGWDRDMRRLCGEHGIVYQGFSLLTANTEVLQYLADTGIAGQTKATPAQIVFAFARAVGMLPLTGTSSAEHMEQDLASRELKLPAHMVEKIEKLAG